MLLSPRRPAPAVGGTTHGGNAAARRPERSEKKGTPAAPGEAREKAEGEPNGRGKRRQDCRRKTPDKKKRRRRDRAERGGRSNDGQEQTEAAEGALSPGRAFWSFATGQGLPSKAGEPRRIL